jgi:hypothetical protein
MSDENVKQDQEIEIQDGDLESVGGGCLVIDPIDPSIDPIIDPGEGEPFPPPIGPLPMPFPGPRPFPGVDPIPGYPPLPRWK